MSPPAAPKKPAASAGKKKMNLSKDVKMATNNKAIEMIVPTKMTFAGVPKPKLTVLKTTRWFKLVTKDTNGAVTPQCYCNAVVEETAPKTVAMRAGGTYFIQATFRCAQRSSCGFSMTVDCTARLASQLEKKKITHLPISYHCSRHPEAGHKYQLVHGGPGNKYGNVQVKCAWVNTEGQTKQYCDNSLTFGQPGALDWNKIAALIKKAGDDLPLGCIDDGNDDVTDEEETPAEVEENADEANDSDDEMANE